MAHAKAAGSSGAYTRDDAFDAIVEVRSGRDPMVLENYARRWLTLDNDAVLTAIVENENAPYAAIELIVEGRPKNLDIVKAAYRHPNTGPGLKAKLDKILDKCKETYTQPFLPGYGRSSGGTH